MYQIDRLTTFERDNEIKLVVVYSEYADDNTLLAQNQSINITLNDDLDLETKTHIEAIKDFALLNLQNRG